MVLAVSRTESLVEALALTDVQSSDLARLGGARLVGTDRLVRHLRPLSLEAPAASASWLSSDRFIDAFAASGCDTVFTTAAVADLLLERGAWSVLVHPEPREAFFAAHVALFESGRYPVLESARGSGGRIAPSAVIHDGVVIGDDVVIGDHVTVQANSVIGHGTVLQAGVVIGGDGFQVGVVGGRRRLIPHAGAVLIGEGVSVGNGTYFDKGLFSTSTLAADEVMIDNLIHVAHDVRLRERATVTAGVILGGLVEIQEDAWLGVNSTVNQLLTIGRAAYVGSGSMVTRDVPSHTLVYGSPAKVAAEVCLCRAKLDGSDGPTCGECGRRFQRHQGELEQMG